MRLKLSYILIVLTFASCKQYQLAQIDGDFQKIEETKTSNKNLNALILPYKTQIDSQMNHVIGFLTTPLDLKQPESTLGNHIADIVFHKSAEYTQIPVDLAIVNLGGIRTEYIPSGNLKTEQAYKIMPFDNYLIVMDIDGKTLKIFFNKMASLGGWPISGAQYEIINQQAENINISGKTFDTLQTYHVAMSDYLAEGGDNCSFLVGLPYTNTKVYFRDAIIEYWTDKKDKQESIASFLEGRIKTDNE